MGQKTQWARTPKGTPTQITILICAIFFYVFAETAYFDYLPDFLRVLLNILIPLLMILTGVKLVSAKELAKQIKDIWKEKGKTEAVKILEILDVVDDALYDTTIRIKQIAAKRQE